MSANSFPEATPAEKISWVLYDWANSGYGLVVIGPIFAFYFITELLPLLPESSDAHGLVFRDVVLPASAIMGLLNSLAMLLMALAAPVLGAVADIRGWTKRLLVLTASGGSLFTLLMYFLNPGDWLAGASLYVGSNFCFGLSFTFYNAYLPRLTRPERQGSLSGWGFAVGYAGGALALILSAYFDDISLGLAFAGAWWLIFSLPAFIFLKEFEPQVVPRGSVIVAGFSRVAETLRNIRQYRSLFLFLLAFLLYNDGVETVISMSPAFATDVLKMTRDELIAVFLLVQFIAFAGALVFGYLADRVGNKKVIALNLLVWLAAVAGAVLVTNAQQFMYVAALVGVVLGGVQAASRSLMAALAPAKIHNEAFGFFAISGKFASIFGPLFYAGFATAISPRAGILSVIPFLLLGLLLLLRVPEPEQAAKVSASETGRGRE
jgi:MFS transporter, UMF1 family